jgi:hypothetical protein
MEKCYWMVKVGELESLGWFEVKPALESGHGANTLLLEGCS